MDFKTTNNRKSVTTGFFAGGFVKATQPWRTSSSFWDYTILTRWKAMDAVGHWPKDPPANEQEKVHD
jgi:heme-degrading monooxygenase HmoA